jgi:hypothetical protein
MTPFWRGVLSQSSDMSMSHKELSKEVTAAFGRCLRELGLATVRSQ